MPKLSFLLVVALVVSLGLGACKRKDPQISDLDRAKAASFATEAQLQTKLRDYAGAEKLLAQAVELDPTAPAYWSGLGINRALLGDKSGAKKAYKKELELCEKASKEKPDDLDRQLTQLRPLVLLGRADDARKLLEKVGRENPNNFNLQQWIASKPVDQMLAAPALKDAILK